MESIDLQNLTVVALKDELKKRGLSVAGLKGELLQRLRVTIHSYMSPLVIHMSIN